MRDAFIARLSEIASRDKRVMLITGDLGFKVLDDFKARFPDQYLNAGVAEQNMTGIATGMALEGRVVFTYSIANFPTLRTLEQLRNGPCYHNLNVNVVSVGGGFSYGALGFSHQATEDLSIMRSLPNTTVVAPADLWEAAEATEALVATPGVGYLRIDKSNAEPSNAKGERYQIGKARTLRDGADFTLIGTGGIVAELLKAATSLGKAGINCRVLSFHTLCPVDTEALIAAATETGGIITVEENTVSGGLGGLVAEVLMESGKSPRKFYRIGLRNEFSTIVGSQEYLRKYHKMDAESIANKVRSLLGAE